MQLFSCNLDPFRAELHAAVTFDEHDSARGGNCRNMIR
jgi:hypothetical protein